MGIRPVGAGCTVRMVLSLRIDLHLTYHISKDTRPYIFPNSTSICMKFIILPFLWIDRECIPKYFDNPAHFGLYDHRMSVAKLPPCLFLQLVNSHCRERFESPYDFR